MPKVEVIQESKRDNKKSSEELLNEIFLICQNEEFFGEQKDRYNNLNEEVKDYKKTLNSKTNLIEKSESYKNSLQNKLEDMNQRILDKRIRLLEELGSSL